MKRFPITLSALLFLLAAIVASAAEGDALRSESVGWARLKTPSEYWIRHAQGDATLMRFFRDHTSLNIDPNWYVADVENLNQLRAYPLLFSQGIGELNTPRSKENLGEYLRRGGFLLIDSCINVHITPDPDVFLDAQQRMLAAIIPEARVVALPTNHAIYRCFFSIPGGKPPHTFNGNSYDPNWARHGLYAIKIGDHLAGIISLSGLQCGWDHMIAPPAHDVACMEMLVNIYVYAMTQGE